MSLAAVCVLLGLGVALLAALVSHPDNPWVAKFKPLTIAFILTLNSLSFGIHSPPQIVEYTAIFRGFPLFWLTRVLTSSIVTFTGRVTGFRLGYILFPLDVVLAFLVDLVFWLVVADFALRFLKVRKSPLSKKINLSQDIFGFLLFTLEWLWMAASQKWASPWESLVKVILMFAVFFLLLAGFFYILLRLKKFPLSRNKLTLGIFGITFFALESYWIVFWEARWISGAYFWEVLLRGILMLAGFFYILSIVGLGEERSTLALVNKNA